MFSFCILCLNVNFLVFLILVSGLFHSHTPRQIITFGKSFGKSVTVVSAVDVVVVVVQSKSTLARPPFKWSGICILLFVLEFTLNESDD